MIDIVLNLDIIFNIIVFTLSVIFFFIGFGLLIIKKRFLNEIDYFWPKSSKLEDMLEWFFLWSGVIALLFGFIGAILVISLGENLVKTEVLQIAFTFVSFYMLFFGMFLIVYHKKIFVRPKVRR